MKYLIVNADDLGLTRGVTDGIVEACEYGVVRSATLFANTENFDYAVSRIKGTSKLGVGVHLTLTHGRPVLGSVVSLMNRNGHFLKSAEFEAKVDSIEIDEICSEFTAQIEKIKKAGISITHLDTHHHIHKIPRINSVVAELSRIYKIGMRRVVADTPNVKSTEIFSTGFHGKSITELDFKLLVKKYEAYESLEMMCHPGHFTADLINESRYLKQREAELSTLTSYELQVHLHKHGIELISFDELPA